MPANMTYDSLVSDVKAYCERPNDANLAAQIPRLVMLAENRIATDLRILGLRQVAEGAFTAGNPVLPKPAYLRRTETFRYTDANGDSRVLYPRTMGFVREFWPDDSATAAPRYYTDYDFDNYLLAPTPSAAFAMELTYIARIAPLDSAMQINWYTANAPQLLLYATLEEAGLFLKNAQMTQLYAGKYKESAAAYSTEDKLRQVDNNIIVGVA